MYPMHYAKLCCQVLACCYSIVLSACDGYWPSSNEVTTPDKSTITFPQQTQQSTMCTFMRWTVIMAKQPSQKIKIHDFVKWKHILNAKLSLCAASDAEHWRDLHLNKELSKQSRRRWFETPSRSLWCHCNMVTTIPIISETTRTPH